MNERKKNLIKFWVYDFGKWESLSEMCEGVSVALEEFFEWLGDEEFLEEVHLEMSRKFLLDSVAVRQAVVASSLTGNAAMARVYFQFVDGGLSEDCEDNVGEFGENFFDRISSLRESFFVDTENNDEIDGAE